MSTTQLYNSGFSKQPQPTFKHPTSSDPCNRIITAIMKQAYNDWVLNTLNFIILSKKIERGEGSKRSDRMLAIYEAEVRSCEQYFRGSWIYDQVKSAVEQEVQRRLKFKRYARNL